MAGFNPFQIFNIISPRMVVRGVLYPYRRAARIARSTQPDVRGPAYWRAVWRALRAPAEPARPPYDYLDAPGRVIGVHADGPHVTITAERATLRISVLAADLVLIRASRSGDFPEPFSYGVAKPEAGWGGMTPNVSDRADRIEIEAGALTIAIDKASGTLTAHDSAGDRPLLAGRGIRHDPQSGQVGWQATFDTSTAFYGLGEKASSLNHAGQRFELWNSDPSGYDRGHEPIYMSIPFVMMLAGGRAAGLFFDNSYRAWIDLGAGEPGVVDYRAADGEFRLYLMAGTPRSVLERYTELTGRTKLPPLWALGFHQSRWSYYPQKRVLRLAQAFRARRLPCDVIHFDIHYLDDYRCFTWDRRRFPDPPAMLNALHEQGFKGLSMVDPGIQVHRGYRVYDEGVAQRRFITYPDGVPFSGPVWPGECHFPDFTDPDTRCWWGDQYAGYLDDGMDAFWNDMNEIAIIAIGTDKPWVPEIVQHSKEGQGGTQAELHNVYGLLMARASAEGIERLRPDRRPAILTRSGWAGMQRHAMHWTGDNKSTWDHLRLSIQMVLTLGLSGVPISGADVGGFTGGPSPELYARWMQLGAFMPFYRVHSMVGSPDQEPWAFGEQVEAICRKYLELRYRLLPYLYTAVWQASQTGTPPMRALAFMFPDDPTVASLDDEYMLGESLLIAPVVEEGATQRRVYLPASEWFDFWSGARHSGPQTLTVDAPLDVLPLFVRGGAVIPFWPVQQYVGEKPVETLELRAYLSPGEHSSLLYEDDGLTPEYARPDAHRVSRFVLDGTQGSLTRHIEQGTYAPGYTRVMIKIAGLDAQPGAVNVEGGRLVSHTWDAQARGLTVELDAEGPFALHFG